jgi:hypothetical protein
MRKTESRDGKSRNVASAGGAALAGEFSGGRRLEPGKSRDAKKEKRSNVTEMLKGK